MNIPFQNIQGEVWESVIGYEGLYEVSNKGRVRSLNYQGVSGNIQLRKLNIVCGYAQVLLCKSGSQSQKLVHRLVYEAFVGKLPKFKQAGKGNGSKMWEINHIDENKLNNHVENLELVTRKQNNNHGTRIKRMADSQRNRQGSKKVYQFTLNGELVKVWPSTAECGRNGYNEGHVAACCRCADKGTFCNVYKNYVWSYSEETSLKIESK